MISIIITACKEPKTIARAIKAVLKNKIKEDYELLVVASDRETLNEAEKLARKYKKIRIIKDKGVGKPAALNIVFRKARGNIFVLTDGDVFMSEDAIKKLTDHFSDKKIGGVTGRVIPLNNVNNMFGFWAFLLTEGFHNLRVREMSCRSDDKRVICSGYLYAIRRGIIRSVPQDVLADDAFISLSINKAGFNTIYEPSAKVYVKYPSNIPDWIRQKKRTAGRFYQLKKEFKISKTSSLIEEIFAGIKTLKNINSFKRVSWFLLLSVLRFYIWFRVFFDFRLWRRSFKKNWQRVESTK